MDRLKGLDGIRGPLAVFVALSHAYSHFTGWGTGYNFFKNATFAVDVFFMLSGMVLYHNYHSRDRDGFVQKFLRARVLRLLPMNVLAMILIPVCLLISTGEAFPGWVGTPSLTKIVSDLFLINNFSGLVPYINPPTWSISSEMFMGSVVVLLCCFRFYMSIIILLAALLVMFLTNFKSHDIVNPVYYIFTGGMIRCAFGISLGIIAYKLATKLTVYPAACNLFNKFAPYALFFILVIMVGVRLSTLQYVLVTGILALTIAMISMRESSVSWLLDSVPLRELGYRSYSIYLLHTPVIYLFLFLKSDNLSHNVFFASLAVLLTIFISKYTARYIETPFTKIMK